MTATPGPGEPTDPLREPDATSSDAPGSAPPPAAPPPPPPAPGQGYGPSSSGPPSYGVQDAPSGYSPAPPPGYGAAPPPPPAGYGQPSYALAPPTQNAKALWSMILGIVGFFVCGLILGPVAIILSRIGAKEITASGGRQTGAGMAKAGLILGIIQTALTLVGVVIWLVLIASASTSTPR